MGYLHPRRRRGVELQCTLCSCTLRRSGCLGAVDQKQRDDVRRCHLQRQSVYILSFARRAWCGGCCEVTNTNTLRSCCPARREAEADRQSTTGNLSRLFCGLPAQAARGATSEKNSGAGTAYTSDSRAGPRPACSRNLVERFSIRIKQFRRMATRYDKLSRRYASFLLQPLRSYGLLKSLSDNARRGVSATSVRNIKQVSGGAKMWPVAI